MFYGMNEAMHTHSFQRFYLPRDLTKTKGGLRGRKSWLTARQTQIAITRVIRDDVSKQSYEYDLHFSQRCARPPFLINLLGNRSSGQTYALQCQMSVSSA